MQERPLGFWSVWALAVGTMIGSGILLVPASLAPFGLLSMGGWVLGAAGASAIIFVFARLAGRTRRDGGPYVYVQEAFGDVAGFVMAWLYWIGFWASIPVVAITFAGYLGVFVPALAHNMLAQAVSALALIAVLTFVNIRGLKEMSVVQIAMTLLKIVPLVAIVAAALLFGTPQNLPPFNPSQQPLLPQFAAVTLITLWPFTGFEAAVSSAGSIRDPERTIPRALTSAVILVAVIYLCASFAVMLLLTPEQLAHSEAPFADAAAALGAWGPSLIAAGALIATAGSLNGIIFACGQMPMAVAEDGRAPAWMAKLNKGGAPYLSLLVSAALGACMLLLNYSRGLVGAYTFMLQMATATGLVYYFFCALAEIKYSWRTARIWTLVALFAGLYCGFAMIGSGYQGLLWSGVLTLAGVPVYFLCRSAQAGSAGRLRAGTAEKVQ